MKDRQRCQSETEARLSSGSAIAVPAITISLKGSLSAAWSHRREEPKADGQDWVLSFHRLYRLRRAGKTPRNQKAPRFPKGLFGGRISPLSA